MIITYSLARSTHELDVSDTDDLAELCQSVERELRSRHPNLDGDTNLTARLADGLLNGLADDQDPVDLGALG